MSFFFYILSFIEGKQQPQEKMMGKAFTKGEKVTLLGSWDNKGTVYFTDAVVHSCGKIQMVLTHEQTGEELGRHFKPVVGDASSVTGFNWKGVFKRMTDADAQKMCLELGEKIALMEREHYESCISRHSGDINYVNAMQESMSEIHEPRFMKR